MSIAHFYLKKHNISDFFIKFLNIGNDVFYKHAKYQVKIYFILGSAKIRKVEVWSRTVQTFKSLKIVRCCHFWCGLEYKVFWVETSRIFYIIIRNLKRFFCLFFKKKSYIEPIYICSFQIISGMFFNSLGPHPHGHYLSLFHIQSFSHVYWCSWFHRVEFIRELTLHRRGRN
jgi:hypothetical protein